MSAGPDGRDSGRKIDPADELRAAEAQGARDLDNLRRAALMPSIVLSATAWSDTLGQFLSNFSLKFMPGVGHFSPTEAPEFFDTEIRAHLSGTWKADTTPVNMSMRIAARRSRRFRRPVRLSRALRSESMVWSSYAR